MHRCCYTHKEKWSVDVSNEDMKNSLTNCDFQIHIFLFYSLCWKLNFESNFPLTITLKKNCDVTKRVIHKWHHSIYWTSLLPIVTYFPTKALLMASQNFWHHPYGCYVIHGLPLTKILASTKLQPPTWMRMCGTSSFCFIQASANVNLSSTVNE